MTADQAKLARELAGEWNQDRKSVCTITQVAVMMASAAHPLPGARHLTSPRRRSTGRSRSVLPRAGRNVWPSLAGHARGSLI